MFNPFLSSNLIDIGVSCQQSANDIVIQIVQIAIDALGESDNFWAGRAYTFPSYSLIIAADKNIFLHKHPWKGNELSPEIWDKNQAYLYVNA